MSDEVKKISFGFSKLAKPKTILSNNKDVKKDDSIQLIDCVEGKSIKIKNEEFKKPDFLVIPLPKQSVSEGKRSNLLQKILHTNATDPENTNDQSNNTSVTTVSTENTTINKIESLDEIAAREIIEDLKKVKNTEEDKQNFTVPLTEIPAGGKESTIDDYESIPVDKFGMAMLRGMGWAPGKGIGKTEQVVSAKQPVLRPKGLGLGADKVLKTEDVSTIVNAPLKLIKGSFVRVIAGVHKDLFGEVIGFDDETGRLIVKMALGSTVLTFNEFMVEVISKDDFHKNSKVINVKKYEEYKMKENTSKGPTKEQHEAKHSSDIDDDRHNYKAKQKPIRQSSESSMDSFEDKKSLKRKQERTNRYSLSPQQNRTENLGKKQENYKKSNNRSSSEVSPKRYSSKHSKQSQSDSRKARRHSSDSSSQERKPDKHKSASYKEYNKTAKHRTSEDSSQTLKHVSRKESKKRSKSSSSESSSYERHSKRKESQSRNKQQYHSVSDSSSYESEKEKHVSRSEYKKKCKKNKEKKKSKRRRSRSYSKERKRRDKSPRKHKSKHR